MAWRDADAQAADAGAGRAGEQNGADRLGADGPRRRLPVSDRCGVSRHWSRGRRSGRGQGDVWRSVVRRDRENQSATECHRARGFDLDPTCEHHTGPRRDDGRNRGRIHVSTRHRAKLIQKPSCARGGYTCCANAVKVSPCESSLLVRLHEQTHTPDLQDQELASLQ